MSLSHSLANLRLIFPRAKVEPCVLYGTVDGAEGDRSSSCCPQKAVSSSAPLQRQDL